MSAVIYDTDGSELKLTTYWKAEKIDPHRDQLADIDYPARATAEEAIADAMQEICEGNELMQVCEWHQRFDPADGESLGSESTGRGYEIDQHSGKATPNF